MVWWIRDDPCGLFSAFLTILLILYSQVVQTLILILPWYGFCIHIPAYTALSALAIISHSRAQFTDPGSVPALKLPAPVSVPNDHHDPNAERRQIVPRVCKRCKTVKPYKAHHCSTCKKCIIRMDHHCPWVNNCVAIFNQKYFLLFLFYTALLCIYSGTMLVARFVSCTHNLRLCSITGTQAVLTIINFVEALVFGLFVLIMMFDQCSAIFDNTPGIDALQNRKGQRRGRYESLKEVFGEPFSWRWFLPINLPTRVYHDFELECEHYQTDEITIQHHDVDVDPQTPSNLIHIQHQHPHQHPHQHLHQHQHSHDIHMMPTSQDPRKDR